ncbi:hypothetical protein [Microbulbifer sediminum]|uniref:hypothetical protein n=1 Tax=Microbulbifer sediminum TaxID=2904250 RepID=UPI001F45F457|nr:hypothetical protein [Microbulbifer sediminum]
MSSRRIGRYSTSLPARFFSGIFFLAFLLPIGVELTDRSGEAAGWIYYPLALLLCLYFGLYTKEFVKSGERELLIRTGALFLFSSKTIDMARVREVTVEDGSYSRMSGQHAGNAVSGALVKVKLRLSSGQQVLLKRFFDKNAYWWARDFAGKVSRDFDVPVVRRKAKG